MAKRQKLSEDACTEIKDLLITASDTVECILFGDCGVSKNIRNSNREISLRCARDLRKAIGDMICKLGWFRLACVDCDAGTEIKTREEAEAAGWIDLDPDPGGFAWTYLGTCPECRKEVGDE